MFNHINGQLKNFLTKLNRKKYDIIPVAVLIFLILLFSIMQPVFISIQNISVMLTYIVSLLILGVGMTFVILTGRIDLSTAGFMGVVNIATVLLFPVLGLWIIPMGILIGAIFGYINGLTHIKLKIPSFISTFGIGGLALSLALALSGGEHLTLATEMAPIRQRFLRDLFLGLNFEHLISFGVAILGYLILKSTTIGRYISAIGLQETVAKLSGIRINNILLFVFVFYGICMGLSGTLFTMRLAMGDPFMGQRYTLMAIAVVAIGGTSLSGGIGGVLQTVVGAAIVTVLINGMNLANTPVYFKEIILGSALVLVVYFNLDRSKFPVIK